MNKQQLASKIWESANKMRSKIEANDYKDYILGFIFYKFLSEKEERFFFSGGMSKDDLKYLNEEDIETVRYSQKNLGYFISYDNLFSTWIKQGKDFDVSNVTEALSAFTRLINDEHKKVFDKIFDTLSTGLSKLGESSSARTKAISDLIHLINDIPMDGSQDYDVLGFIYEYLISQFAANAGKKAGEFYTPHEVSMLMSEIVAEHLKNKEKIEIYDPTSGSGSLLINIGYCVSKHLGNKNNIKYYAQELKENTYNLTRMNLIMRGILPDNILVRNGDTLEEDWPYFDENDKITTYNPLYVDAVVSNPPYSQSWDPVGKESEARYREYGVAPKSKADYAFLLHDLYHIKHDGIMTIVLPHGVLFRGGNEAEIRKNLIEKNNIDAIIGLPANIFYGTGIPTIIMVLKQKRENTDVLIIDASKGFIKQGKNNKLRTSDIRKIVDVVKARTTIEGFSKVVSKEEIRNNEYNLNIPRYVDSSEKAETYDIYATMFGGIPNSEINDLNEFWTSFPSLKNELFVEVDSSYSQIKNKNINDIINKNVDVNKFINDYNSNFASLNEFLETTLIKNISEVNANSVDEYITRDIFERLKNIKLINKYDAYQTFSDSWNKIYSDIETIQTEGIDMIKSVVPNIVVKKKDGKEVEVQEGYVGSILPFELVQKEKLSEKLSEIAALNSEIDKIKASYEEILESLSEEEKSADFVNEDGDAFVPKAVKEHVKALGKNPVIEKDSIEDKLIKLSKLFDNEKSLNKEIKILNDDLHLQTKEYIESLSNEDALVLLSLKWNKPIIEGLYNLPNVVLNSLITKLNYLCKKYDDTLVDIEQNINSTALELSELLDDLVGDEYDMEGLKELKKLIAGEING